MKAGTLSLVIVVSLLFISSIAAQDTVRVEKDLLDRRKFLPMPTTALTARALENFQISDITINHYPGFVEHGRS